MNPLRYRNVMYLILKAWIVLIRILNENGKIFALVSIRLVLVQKVQVSFSGAWHPFRGSYALFLFKIQWPLLRVSMWYIHRFQISIHFFNNHKKLPRFNPKICNRSSIFLSQCKWGCFEWRYLLHTLLTRYQWSYT